MGTQAVSRLKGIAGVHFEESDLEALKTASHWRNLVVHFEFEFADQVLKPVFARLFGFLSHFHQKYLQEDLRNHVTTDLWEEAISITAYGEEIFKRVQEQMKRENIDPDFVWICVRCGWECFVIQDDMDTCLACGYQEEVVECNDCKIFFTNRKLNYLTLATTRD